MRHGVFKFHRSGEERTHIIINTDIRGFDMTDIMTDLVLEKVAYEKGETAVNVKREICKMYHDIVKTIDKNEFDIIIKNMLNVNNSDESNDLLRATILKAYIDRNR